MHAIVSLDGIESFVIRHSSCVFAYLQNSIQRIAFFSLERKKKHEKRTRTTGIRLRIETSKQNLYLEIEQTTCHSFPEPMNEKKRTPNKQMVHLIHVRIERKRAIYPKNLVKTSEIK